jgi:predicted ATP-binding protein involved in virulence
MASRFARSALASGYPLHHAPTFPRRAFGTCGFRRVVPLLSLSLRGAKFISLKKKMKVNYLRLRNYKCFEALEFELNSAYNLHIFLAENMAGKTAILKAIRIALSVRLQKLDTIAAPISYIPIEDHRVLGNNIFSDIAREVEIEIECTSNEWIRNSWRTETFRWLKSKDHLQNTRKKAHTQYIKNNITNTANNSFSRVLEKKEQTNPLLLYVGAEYLYQTKPRIDSFTAIGAANQGYWYCLADKNMAKYVFDWFQTLHKTFLEQEKNPNAKELYGDLPSQTLNIFKSAVSQLLPNIINIAWVKNTIPKTKAKKANLSEIIEEENPEYFLTFQLEKEGLRTYEMLSDGYKYLVLLLGELVTRAVLLNKHKQTNLLKEITGVVLIDEFGVHLHPKLQADAITRLTQIFPNIQFIVTTHSPLLVGGLASEQLHILDIDQNGQRIIRQPEINTVGLDADGILTQIFDLEYTYDAKTYALLLRRRQLFAKKQFDFANFTKQDGLELQNLTIQLSDYTDNYGDGLFYEFIHELDKIGGLAAYRNISLSEEEKTIRRQQANVLLEKIKQKRQNS